MKARAWVMIPKSKNKGTKIEMEMLPLVQCGDCRRRETKLCPFWTRFKGTKHDDWFCADGVKKEETIDIREIAGLWCDDITFCQEECELESCPRNKLNIRDKTIPHSFSVEIPQDCPKRQEGR